MDVVTACASCGLQFTGTSGFDAHRTGAHAFTFREGLRMEPPREDGRRCLHPEEMRAAGMELVGDLWRIVPSEKQLQGLARMRASAPTNAQKAIEGLEGTSARAAA